MTGKYIDFKGKLKVGDRVRVNSEEACTITSVDDRGFGYRCGDTDFYKVWGTLELLSPSPRIVTREDLRFGTIVRLKNGLILQWIGQVDIRGSQDFLWRTIWSPFATTVWVNKNPDDMDFDIVPEALAFLTPSENVQPASPPAPAEATFSNVRCYDGPMSREQFEKILKDGIERKPAPAEKEEEWWEGHFNRHFPNPEDSWIKTWTHFLVDEAKRRGAEEAWKEALRIAQSHTKFGDDGFKWIGHCFFINDVADKIESLNRPAGAGEK